MRFRSTLDQRDPRELREWLASLAHRRARDKCEYRDADSVLRFLQRPEVQEEIQRLFEDEKAIKPASKMAPATQREDRHLHRAGWVASADAYEALDAMAPGAIMYFNEVHVRRADAGLSQHAKDKLFCVDRIRNIATERFLPIAEAVRFVLNPPSLENPFAHLARKQQCPKCGALTKDRRGLRRCTPCMLEMCDVCMHDHQEIHASDPNYVELPTPDQLQRESETFVDVADVLDGLKPFAPLQMPSALKLVVE